MPNSTGNVYNIYAYYWPIILFSCTLVLLLSNESNSCKYYTQMIAKRLKIYHNSIICNIIKTNKTVIGYMCQIMF